MIRWLLWTFRCRRGRLCADLHADAFEGPPGLVGVIVYRCSGCGTRYSRSVIAGEDGAFTQTDRVRA